MIRCAQCGTECRDTDVICPRCGQVLALQGPAQKTEPGGGAGFPAAGGPSDGGAYFRPPENGAYPGAPGGAGFGTGLPGAGAPGPSVAGNGAYFRSPENGACRFETPPSAGYGGPAAAGGPVPPAWNQVPGAGEANPMAVTAMVLGIISIPMLSLCLSGAVTAVLAVIFGCIALSSIKRAPAQRGKGFAIAGIACGVGTFVMMAVIFGTLAALSYFSSPLPDSSDAVPGLLPFLFHSMSLFGQI